MTLGNWFALLVALVVAAEVVRALRHRALRQERWRRFFRLRTTSWGLGILTFLVLVALAAPLLAPFDPNRQLDIVHLTNRPPSWTFLLGTDPLSRDVWSRLVYWQVLEHGSLSAEADAQHLTRIPLTPTRGMVYDRNGQPLAVNSTVYDVTLAPDMVPAQAPRLSSPSDSRRGSGPAGWYGPRCSRCGSAISSSPPARSAPARAA